MNHPNKKMFSRSQQPLYLQVSTIFRRNIEEGTWRQGCQVPSLDKLVDELGVSRATIRQAMSILEHENLIKRLRGSGTYVEADIQKKKVNLNLPKTWKETVELSLALNTLELMEYGENSALPDPLGIGCECARSAGYYYMSRLHSSDAGPFCYSHVYIENNIYKKHQNKFKNSTIAPVLDKLYGHRLNAARQSLRIIEAGEDSARILKIPVSSSVAEVTRFACVDSIIVYFARLQFPARDVHMEFDLLT